jgi:hypothetical protein
MKIDKLRPQKSFITLGPTLLIVRLEAFSRFVLDKATDMASNSLRGKTL